MRALTIEQPGASTVAYGSTKKLVNLTWATGYRGPVLIHAGATVNRSDGRAFEHVEYPLNAIIAVAELVDLHAGRHCNCLPVYGDAYHWILARVRPLRRPTPCKGFGLWKPSDNVRAAVDAELQGEPLTGECQHCEQPRPLFRHEGWTSEASDEPFDRDGPFWLCARCYGAREIAHEQRAHFGIYGTVPFHRALHATAQHR